MKILIPVFKFGNAGGYRVLSKLANYFIENGNDVTFLVFCDSDKPYFETKAEVLILSPSGNRVSNYCSKSKFPFNYFYKILSLIKAIERYGKFYDIVLATQSLTAFPVYKSNVMAKKFYYIQAYEPEMYNLKGLKYKIFEIISKKSYSYDLIKIVNSEIYLDYKEITSKKVVYPGIDLDIFYPKNKVYTQKKDILKIGCIGRIEKFKGTELVIEAFQKLKSLGYSLELHVAYNLKLESDYQEIVFVVPENDYELSNYYRSLDILIAPGTIQLGAIHYPVLEAMACKTPVITTNYSRSNINNAFLVETNNVDSIVDTVIYMINNIGEVENRALNGLKNVLDFEWERSGNKMLEYFNSN